ncbi:MAG: hypothetical protein GC164_14115 [Phycisphaera sp.]|nr:hypothetical protein [Phycisphaera sp.]
MARRFDPTQLSQQDLLQIVNATPMGAVLTRSRLRRQMDAGGFKFGDGESIHLAHYARWLVDELDNPPLERAARRWRGVARVARTGWF